MTFELIIPNTREEKNAKHAEKCSHLWCRQAGKSKYRSGNPAVTPVSVSIILKSRSTSKLGIKNKERLSTYHLSPK